VIRIGLHCIKHIFHCLNFPFLGYRLAILQRLQGEYCIGNAGNRGQHSSELEAHHHLLTTRTIRFLTRLQDRSGGYVAKQLAVRVESLQEKGHTVLTRSMTSHEGSEGDDVAAKEATWPHGGSQHWERGARADLFSEMYASQVTLKIGP
jgi:hypothetical protein